jgi:hypothetical protein
MIRTILPPTTVLAATLAVLLALAFPAYPQTSMSDLAADEEGNLLEPRPPRYEVTEDGTLVIEGDMVVPCSEVGGPPGQYETRNVTPGVRAEFERERREGVRACLAAGFGTAGEPSAGVSASSPVPAPAGAGPAPPGSPASSDAGPVLPETGGPAPPAPPAWAAAALLLAGGLLVLRVPW